MKLSTMPIVCMRRRRDRDAWLLGETMVEGEIQTKVHLDQLIDSEDQ